MRLNSNGEAGYYVSTYKNGHKIDSHNRNFILYDSPFACSISLDS